MRVIGEDINMDFYQKLNVNKIRSNNETKKLHKTLLFNVFFWGGLAIAAMVSILILSNQDLAFCFNSECFSYFKNIFSFPIENLSATLIIVGFLALLNKSNQTSHQIDISINQNIFRISSTIKRNFITL